MKVPPQPRKPYTKADADASGSFRRLKCYDYFSRRAYGQDPPHDLPEEILGNGRERGYLFHRLFLRPRTEGSVERSSTHRDLHGAAKRGRHVIPQAHVR